MANLNIGNFSQRRTEAHKFLSCISLDGTYSGPIKNVKCKDIVLSEQENGKSRKCNKIVDSAAVTEICDTEYVSKKCYGTIAFKSVKCDDDCYSISSDTDNISISKMEVVMEPIVTKSILSHSSKSKKRVRASNSESGTKNNITPRKKKVQHSATCSDSEYHYGSNENIDPVATSHLKTKAATSKIITKQNGHASVKFVNSINNHVFHGERIIMLTDRHLPFLVCSIIPYEKSEKNEKSRSDFHKEVFKKRHSARQRITSLSGDFCNRFDLFGVPRANGLEVSYEKLLVPSRAFKEFLAKKQSPECSTDYLEHVSGKNHQLLSRTKVLTRKPGCKWCYSYDQATQKSMKVLSASPPILNTKDNILMPSPMLYNPALLDDPELMAGRHRTLLTLSSYITSIIDYVRPCDLKKEINDKFKEKFPYIKLTLSKLRSIKKDMCKAARTESGAEYLTIAQAYVYFEKLILRGLINKQNRKLCAAASLLLSAKLNDFKGDTLKVLIERMENIFRLNRKELLESEFAVLVALEFSLHVPTSEISPHYQRLLCAL